MERARDTGAVAASGKVDLAEEADEGRQAGFLMYIAVYRGAPRAAADQERLLRGWVFAPVRIGDLLDDLFDDEPGPAIGLSVYDAATPRPEALLQQDALSSQPPLAVHETRIDVGGRPWLLRFSAAPAFASRVSRALQPAVLVLGLALTFLITWVTWREATARRRAERAGRRSAFLAEAGEVLASSLDYRRTLAQVAHLASERIADGCVIGLLEPEGPFWITAHADPELALRLAQALRAEGLGPEARVGMAAALRTRTPIVVHDLAASVPPRRSLALGAELREESVTAALSVPLLARDEPLGGVTLLATSPGARFDTADAALAEDLARFAVAAVDTARLYRRAQEAVDARDEFLSVASHELRTPLSSLALQSESLRISAHRLQDEGLAARAELLRRNVDRLAWLVATLLDISRITAGRLEVELEDVDLAQLARDVVQRFEEEARRASCHLVVDAPAPVLGRWDRLRLDQVITNLLSNAIKYGPGEPVEVKVAAGQGRAVLAVRDHGIGIASIDQPRIFERFERAAPKTAKRDYGGFGLGLWIVRRVVEALGGTVRVESTLGEGSTFIVELVSTPISPPRAAPPGVASDAAARGGG
jgi:signal transduction histidine kinase